MTHPTEAAWTQAQTIRSLAELLCRDWLAVIDTLTAITSDGYPSGGTGSGGDTTSVEAAVMQRERWVGVWNQMCADLERAANAMSHLDARRRQLMGITTPPAPAHVGLASCCNVHGCPDGAWASKAGRCNACYEYQRRTGRDRTRAA